MKCKDTVKVFLYFLGFDANDLKVFYDNAGISLVAYSGKNEFLQDTSVIRHCFEEGYIERRGNIAFVLYAFTDDPEIAKLFESSRNMHLFSRTTEKMSKDDFSKLCRFKEAKLFIEPLLHGKDAYISVAITQFEFDKIVVADEDFIVTTWAEPYEVFEFLLTENGNDLFMNDLLSDSLVEALSKFEFGYFLGTEVPSPIDHGAQINEWNVFWLYFGDTMK